MVRFGYFVQLVREIDSWLSLFFCAPCPTSYERGRADRAEESMRIFTCTLRMACQSRSWKSTGFGRQDIGPNCQHQLILEHCDLSPCALTRVHTSDRACRPFTSDRALKYMVAAVSTHHMEAIAFSVKYMYISISLSLSLYIYIYRYKLFVRLSVQNTQG